MEYNWRRDDFLREIDKLREIIEQESDLKRRIYLQKVLDTTNKVFHETFSNFPSPSVTAKQRLTSILDSVIGCSRYYSIVEAFYSETMSCFDKINDITDRLKKISPDGEFDFMMTGAKFSIDKVLSLTAQFYKQFDSDLNIFFEEAFKDRFNYLRVIECDNPDLKSDGNTIFIDGVRKNFITLYDANQIGLCECAVHEYGHAIQNLINPEVSYSDRIDFFVEVAALFPELVYLYENTSGFERIQATYRLYCTLITYIDSAEHLSLHIPIVNEWTDSKYKMSRRFFEELTDSFDIDDECFETTLSTTIEDEGNYVLSFIVALELFHIYKQDKKRALELFKKFLNVPANEDIFTFVQENFELNKHAKEEAQLIIDDFSKELSKRRG